MCFNGFDLEMVWSENFHFKPFPDSRAKTERERWRRESVVLKPSSSLTTTATHSLDQAPIQRPQTELQSDDPHSTGLVDRSTALIALVSSIATPLQSHHAFQAKIDSNTTWSSLHIHCTISPLDQT